MTAEVVQFRPTGDREIEKYLNSPEYIRCGERFNREEAERREREREFEAWFDPTQPFGIRR
jgi:hypothetical protein